MRLFVGLIKMNKINRKNLLEIGDLGRVYFHYLKSSFNGSVFFILIKNISNSSSKFNSQTLKLTQIESLLNKPANKMSESPIVKDIEDTYFPAKHLKVKLEKTLI